MEEKETVKKTATKKTSTTTAKSATKATAEKKTAVKTTAKKAETTATKKTSTKATAVAEETATPAVAEKKPETGKQVKITLVKSTIGCLKKQIRTVQALGLRKIRQSVVMPDNACTRGMIFVVRHLVSVEEVK